VIPINYLPAAIADLDDIFDYIADYDRDAAQRTIDRIYGAALRLQDYPRSAPQRPQLGPGIHSLLAGRFLILYRIEQDRVDVVRVIHGSRDLRGLLT